MNFSVEEKKGYFLVTMQSKVFSSAIAKEYDKIINNSKKKKFVVDLSKCEYVGSSSIGNILNSWHLLNKRLAFIISNDDLKKIFDVTNLLEVMQKQVFDNFADAKSYIENIED